MGLVFAISAIPDIESTHGVLKVVPNTVQNLLHIPAYGLLALLWIRALMAHGMAEQRAIFIAFLLASGYGALMEFAQAWIPGRFPSLSDFIFDLTGVLLFIYLYRQIKFRYEIV